MGNTSKTTGDMGFRHLSSFSLALLAKQAWRSLQYPDSISSKLFKLKYFPNSSLLDAILRANPLFIGISIH